MITIANVLSPEALSSVRRELDRLDWRDGADTAGQVARRVKRNSQADLSDEVGVRLRKRLTDAILRHPVFMSAARPHKLSPLMISRSGVGDGYGMHIDNAFMGSGSGQIRTDLSYTLFLSEPDSYEGGELRVETMSGTETVKLAAGDLILYPSTTLHEVCPVTSGERLVAIGWVQSHLRDARQREILFDLDNLKVSLGEKYNFEDPEILTIHKTISNLMRLWGGD